MFEKNIFVQFLFPKLVSKLNVNIPFGVYNASIYLGLYFYVVTFIFLFPHVSFLFIFYYSFFSFSVLLFFRISHREVSPLIFTQVKFLQNCNNIWISRMSLLLTITNKFLNERFIVFLLFVLQATPRMRSHLIKNNSIFMSIFFIGLLVYKF